jgi:hypothetical protein
MQPEKEQLYPGLVIILEILGYLPQENLLPRLISKQRLSQEEALPTTTPPPNEKEERQLLAVCLQSPMQNLRPTTNKRQRRRSLLRKLTQRHRPLYPRPGRKAMRQPPGHDTTWAQCFKNFALFAKVWFEEL